MKTKLNNFHTALLTDMFTKVFTAHIAELQHWKNLKGCVRYIFASLFLSLNESTCQMKKNVFYFTSKPLFVFEKIKF